MQHNGWDRAPKVTADLIRHLIGLNSPRKTVLFTTGWMITEADEDAIRSLPAGAWKPGLAQDGTLDCWQRLSALPALT